MSRVITSPRYTILLACSVACISSLLVGLPSAASTDPTTVSLNGHTISGPFYAYWLAHGQISALGNPITDPAYEVDLADGQQYLTQWFERVRMEVQGQNPNSSPQVVLGKLGNELRHAATAVDPDFQAAPPLADPPFLNVANYRYFNDTHHNVRDPFLAYWQKYGGPASFGSPISEEHLEFDNETGKFFVMQWFERARFEFHPENTADNQVELGLLGNEIKAHPHQFSATWKIGQSSSFLNDPNAVFVGGSGAIYVNDRGKRRINKYTVTHELADFWYMPNGTQAIAGITPTSTSTSKDTPILYQIGLYPGPTGNSVQELMGDGQWHSLALTDASDPDSLTPNQALAVDPTGIIYILKFASQSRSLVWAYDPKGQFIGKYIPRDSVGQPTALALANGTLYLADGSANKYWTYALSGTNATLSGVALPPPTAPATGNALSIAVTEKADTVFVGEPGHIVTFDKNGTVAGTYSAPGAGAGQIYDPLALAVDGSGTLYVADPDNHQVSLFDNAGTYTGSIRQSAAIAPGYLAAPTSVVVLPGTPEQIAVADPATARIQTFSAGGKYTQKWPAPHIVAMAPDTAGHIYALNRSAARVSVFDSNGTVVSAWGSSGTAPGQFILPASIAVGTDGSVYVADTGNQRIQKFDSKGTFLSMWGTKGTANGQFGGDTLSDVFSGPTSISYDLQARVVYVVDPANARIQKFDDGGTFLGSISHVEGGRPFAPVAVAAAPAPTAASAAATQGPTPTGLATGRPVLAGAGGGIYILCADALYRLDGNGTVTAQLHASTVVGGISAGTTGDGNINNGTALAVDASGGIFLVNGDGRIQKLQVGQ